nr:MAG TPA: hypothetical protein [Caudoviricetes sp.]
MRIATTYSVNALFCTRSINNKTINSYIIIVRL